MTESILTRTSKAIYRADQAPKKSDWSHLAKTEQRRYESMAAAALAVALSEPVYPDLSLADFDKIEQPA